MVDESEEPILDKRSHILFTGFSCNAIPVVALVSGEAEQVACVLQDDLLADLRIVTFRHRE